MHRRENTVETDSGLWRYSITGDASETVLVLPGALGTRAALPLVDALCLTFRVVCVSYGNATTMRETTAALARILDAEKIRRTHVVGASYGSVIAQFLAFHEPSRVGGVALVHGFRVSPADAWRFRLAMGLGRVMPPRLMRWLLRRRLERMVLNPIQAASHMDVARWKETVSELSAALLSGDAVILQQRCLHDAAMHWPEAVAFGTGFAQRLLIVDSDNDPVISPAARRALVSAYPGATVKTFQGTGHLTSIVATEALAATIREFLRALPPICP